MSSLQPGTEFLHYRIVEKIGQGGMGEVYSAEDTKLRRRVAIKMLPATAKANRVARQRLLREARSASALNHPNIVTIFTIEEHQENDLIVMELVEGETLREMVARGSLDLAALLDIGIQTASALDAAHRAGLIHRDVKSDNILIGAGGHVKVLDFGLARPNAVDGLLSASDTDATVFPEITASGVICGTVAYMSPEQTRGEELDERTDVFSLGTVLYEAATGRVPFEGPSVLSVMHEIATVEKPPPSHLRPGLPAEFDAILRRALAKEKSTRYASAAEFRSELERLRERLTGTLDFGIQDHSYVFASAREGFVGRLDELKRLDSLLRDALRGHGHVVLLSGEPGMGKTALAQEFLDRTHRQFPYVAICRGQCAEQYGTGEAYLPFLEALAALMAGSGRERLAGILKTYAPTWCLQFPAALTSTSSLEALQRETIGATKERMLREMGDALGALAAASPVVMLIEDLQWADPSSVELLGHLSHRIDSQRVLVVATYRADEVLSQNHPLKKTELEMRSHDLCDSLELGPVGKDQVVELLNARFSPNDFAEPLADLIHRKTEGHPLFVTSFAQYLAESGDFVKVDDCWTLARPIAEIDPEAPDSVRSMIRKKLEAIGESELRALRYASVEGTEFTSTILATLLSVEEIELEEQLKDLDRSHRLIVTIGEEEFPDGELTTRYRFAHSLYQNLLYSDLVSKRRVQLHRLAGERLLKHSATQSHRFAAQLALHFERGRDFEKAVRFYLQAGDNAMKVYANDEAAQQFSQAVELAGRIPEESRSGFLLTAYQKRGVVNFAMSAFDSADADFRASVALARQAGDPDLECTCLNLLSRTLFFAHRVDEMAQVSKEAIRVSGRARSEGLRAETLIPLALKHVCYGELNEAKSLGDEIIRISRATQNKSALLAGLTRRGIVHFFQSEYETGRAMIEEALRLAEELRDGFAYLQAHFELGLILGNLGRMTEALDVFDRATIIARKNGDKFWLSRFPNCIGWVHGELQNFEGALKHDGEGVAISRRERILEAEANSLINLGSMYTETGSRDRAPEVFDEVKSIFDRDSWFRWRYNIRLQSSASEHWIRRGDLDKAELFARKLLDLAEAHGARKYVTTGYKLLGEIALERGNLDEADRRLAAAVEVIERFPAPLVAWKTYATIGRLRQAQDDRVAARREFDRALAIVDEIAANVDDDALRENFLISARVRELWAYTS